MPPGSSELSSPKPCGCGPAPPGFGSPRAPSTPFACQAGPGSSLWPWLNDGGCDRRGGDRPAICSTWAQGCGPHWARGPCRCPWSPRLLFGVSPVSFLGGRLRSRPRTCCGCGCGCRAEVRAVPTTPGRRSPPRAPGVAEGRRGNARPAAGPSGTRSRAASGAKPSAPSGLGEAAPAPRASSGAHPPPRQHFGPCNSPEVSKSPLPGSVAGPGEGPEATAGPRAGAQDAQPRSAAEPAARRGPAPPPAAAPPLAAVPSPFAAAAVTQRAGNGCGEGLPAHP